MTSLIYCVCHHPLHHGRCGIEDHDGHGHYEICDCKIDSPTREEVAELRSVIHRLAEHKRTSTFTTDHLVEAVGLRVKAREAGLRRDQFESDPQTLLDMNILMLNLYKTEAELDAE